VPRAARAKKTKARGETIPAATELGTWVCVALPAPALLEVVELLLIVLVAVDVLVLFEKLVVVNKAVVDKVEVLGADVVVDKAVVLEAELLVVLIELEPVDDELVEELEEPPETVKNTL